MQFSQDGPLYIDGSQVKPQLHIQDFGHGRATIHPDLLNHDASAWFIVAACRYICMNCSSTEGILEESWWFGNLQDKAMTSLNRYNLLRWFVFGFVGMA